VNKLNERRAFLRGACAAAAAGTLAALDLHGSPARAADGATARATDAAPAAPFRIDVHHHISPPAYTAEMRTRMQPPSIAWTPQKSLDEMDESGIATAILSVPAPGVWIGDDAQGRRLARLCNEFGAGLMSDHPGRFGLFATLPLPDTEGSLREIEYGLDVLHADGIGLLTSYRDRWLGDPSFEPVMLELNRRKALVYVHPDTPLCCRGNLRELFNNSVIEFTADTTRAIAGLLFRGTINRYREIRWIFSHGGGTVPFIAERLTRIPETYKNLAAAVPDGVMAELRRFYYDTAQASHPAALAALTRIFPLSQLLWGTDFPYRHGLEYVRQQRDYGFTAADLRAIERDNALALLPRLRTSARATAG